MTWAGSALLGASGHYSGEIYEINPVNASIVQVAVDVHNEDTRTDTHVWLESLAWITEHKEDG